MRYRLITPPSKRVAAPEPGSEKLKPRKLRHFLARISLALLIITLGYLILAYSRPLPKLSATKYVLNSPATAAIQLPWPGYGQAALGANGFGLLAAHGSQSSAPMASVAKVVTALSVLKQKPLQPGQQGPNIIIGQTDIDTYNDYFTQGSSLVPVVVDERISEYQALQALLIPSANNFADTLARWAFGSVDNYMAYANQWARTMDLKQTYIADASGLSPKTVSSPQDLVKIGLAALDNPVIADIVKQPQANLPVVGVVRNTNELLGSDGIMGIKTGNTDQAGGCFLFAAKRTVEGRPLTVVGAIMGAPSLASLMNDVRPLLQASDKGFRNLTIVKASQPLGIYKAPWGGGATAVAKSNLQMFVWGSTQVQTSVSLNPAKTSTLKGTEVGAVTATAVSQTKKTAVVLTQPIKGPSLSWRLWH